MAKNSILMKMGLDSSGVKAGLDDAQNKVKTFTAGVGSKLKTIGPIFAGMFAGAGLAGIKRAIDNMTELKRTADRLGVSTESFQRLSYAAQQMGVDTDRLADAMKDLDVKLQDGIMRGGSFAELIQELGMDINKLAMMKPDERMLAFSDAIKNASGSLSRFGADEFGDAMFELLPLLEMGSDGIRKLGEEAVIMSDAQILAAERAQKTIDGHITNLSSQLSIWIGNGLQLFEWLLTGATQVVIELTNIFSEFGTVLKGVFTLDPELIGKGLNDVTKAAEGSLYRVKEAMNDVLDEQIAEERTAKHKQEQTKMTAAELARLKTAGDAEKKARAEWEKGLEKATKLSEQAADEREKRALAAMTSEEKLYAIQQKILTLRKEIDEIDPFKDGAPQEIAAKKLEIEKLITEEQKTQVEVGEDAKAAQQAAIEAQMKELELRRLSAEAAGDAGLVNQLDRQIERQNMINELVDQYGKSEQEAARIVDNIIAKKDRQKALELEVVKAQADGNDALAAQLQMRIDKEQEAIDLMREFNLSLEDATALAGQLAAMRAGPDLNQSGIVTPREQKIWDEQQKEKQREFDKQLAQEKQDEREIGNRWKNVSEERRGAPSSALKSLERKSRDIRRDENKAIGDMMRRIDRGQANQSDLSNLQAAIQTKRAAREQQMELQKQVDATRSIAERNKIRKEMKDRQSEADEIADKLKKGDVEGAKALQDKFDAEQQARDLRKQAEEASKAGDDKLADELDKKAREAEAEAKGKEPGGAPGEGPDKKPGEGPGEGPDKKPDEPKPATTADVVKAINDNGSKLEDIKKLLTC